MAQAFCSMCDLLLNYYYYWWLCPPVSLFTCICSRWLKHFAQCVMFCSRSLRLRGGTTILLFLARIAGQNAIHTSLVRLFTFSVVAQPTTVVAQPTTIHHEDHTRCRLHGSILASQCFEGKFCIGLRKLSGARIAGQNAIH